ncbi:hypothetical protein DENSPDRAFT_833844 [Dentipellis sp. KUC8613]|nr:hypothetical protein DENSPDRAFT_833844 [Dentipellis sp. KUC8613]
MASGMVDDDAASIPDSPVLETPLSEEELGIQKQRLALQTWVASVPYECETPEAMQEKLEFIIGKMAICIETKNWLVLTTWDGVLQCWMLMRYPISKPIRAKLVRLYYELCLLPGIEPRVVRSWADMIQRLLSSKSDVHRKLKPTDLQLPWKPLWRLLKKELWPKSKRRDPTRNVGNILVFVAEKCRRYYPAEEIPEMLSTFIPLVTQSTFLTMIPVLTSFLPPTHTHLYVPALFQIWEAFNSAVLDEQLIDLAGDLAEEHVAGTFGLAGPEGGAQWKDVGIWTDKQWTLLVGKALASMNVPVGATRSPSSTGGDADSGSVENLSLRIHKAVDRYEALAKLIVYSIAVDGPVRDDKSTARSEAGFSARQTGYLAGSKALDSLDKLITSTESFFHPSNSGLWTLTLTMFLSKLSSQFIKRVKEEEQSTCKTPEHRRITPAIRRAFVTTLRTVGLLAMFSKDPLSMGLAQSALRTLALVEPALIMPELLERAYGGLEVVNETHRTTAVLSCLAGVALPLVSERIWLGGQKHVVPLLELCIPGIDLNDTGKTLCTTMFIVSVIECIKIGDLSLTQSGLSISSDAPADDQMSVDNETRLPDGIDVGESSVLSREEERLLVRESTASFADWVTSLLRRVLALYENLPEEGGKNRTTGGKQEEAVLKALRTMLDVVCIHVSDPLFDIILKLVFEYGTTNAKANAVRAFGQLVSALARAQPEKTINKFLPFCIAQIKDELKHGASSVRTTSSTLAVSSDTTLHWNMSILRGCFGFGGTSLLKHKAAILDLLSTLADKTLNERGFTGTGRLLTRILTTLSSVYPVQNQFVNADKWNSSEFDNDHNSYWGHMYEAHEVKIDWHIPSDEEIAFVLDILDTVVSPALDKVDALLQTANTWDNIAQNDFCRYLQICRCAWAGLPTLFKQPSHGVVNSCLNRDAEVEGLLVSSIDVEAGFCLADPTDPRFLRASAHRQRFGEVLHHAATALGHDSESEDHIDAVMSVAKSIDVYLLKYALGRMDFIALQKNYSQARDAHRAWPKQKKSSRLVFLKRAVFYHSSRLYMHALYRRRSELDDSLLGDLLELSLSPYTRVRRHSQAVLHNACGYYIRSTRFILDPVFNALAKGTDPDRMKGALYILCNKGLVTYAISDPKDPMLYGRYLVHLLQCQHQEKPSIQKLVNSVAHESAVHLAEEAVRTDTYSDDVPGVLEVLEALKTEFSSALVDATLLDEARKKSPIRAEIKLRRYNETVAAIVDIASNPSTHWRYVQIALLYLYGLLRRDAAPSAGLAKLFIEHTISPHLTLRHVAQKGIIKLAGFVRSRTFAASSQELWFEEGKNPLSRQVAISSNSDFFAIARRPIEGAGAEQAVFIDKPMSGFFTWATSTKGSAPAPAGNVPFVWDVACQPALDVIRAVISRDDYFSSLLTLWGQESGKTTNTPELRSANVTFIKAIAKIYQGAEVERILSETDPLLWDADRFKQRAGAEVIAGLTRGSKHWPKQLSERLWSWFCERLDRIFLQIKPDTLGFWDSVINAQLASRDPRRHPGLVSWILNLPLDLQGDSAFATTKALTMFNCFTYTIAYREPELCDKYFNMFLENSTTSYAEMRMMIAQNLYMMTVNRWRPTFPSTERFLQACATEEDPFNIRQPLYLSPTIRLVQQLTEWKSERLPPPRVNQSQYDKAGLTLLRWTAIGLCSSQAPLVFPYILHMLPEFLRMTELSDSPELQAHSQAVLYILSAVSPPKGLTPVIASHFVDAIKSSAAWRIRLNALPTLIVFLYRNLLSIPDDIFSSIMDVLLKCLADDNVEVREMASKALSGVVRVSQRQSIVPLRDHFVALARKVKLPNRQDPTYAEKLRTLHSAIVGICALIESFPYSVEKWMPPLTDVLAVHTTDPPPISTTIRKCASEFKKTHQDTWHKDQEAFDEDQLQNLSTMLVGTSYYA